MKKILLFLFLTASAFAQIVYIGPFNGTPIDPSQCVVSPQNQTGICVASDGVHVSLTGQPYGPPLPAQAATITAGSVTLLPTGSQPTVTNSGTLMQAVFNFALPSGPSGPQGIQGIPGTNGSQGPQGIQGVPGPNWPVAHVNITCPVGKGSIPAGFTSLNCVMTIVSIP